MDPIDAAAFADSFGDPIEAVADDAIDPANTDRLKDFDDEISDFLSHVPALLRHPVSGSLAGAAPELGAKEEWIGLARSQDRYTKA
jgi:hypothetical protein